MNIIMRELQWRRKIVSMTNNLLKKQSFMQNSRKKKTQRTGTQESQKGKLMYEERETERGQMMKEEKGKKKDLKFSEQSSAISAHTEPGSRTPNSQHLFRNLKFSPSPYAVCWILRKPNKTRLQLFNSKAGNERLNHKFPENRGQ